MRFRVAAVFIAIHFGRLLMQKHKVLRWRMILRRSAFHRNAIRSCRRLRRSRFRAVRICSTVILSIAWLVLPLLPGCVPQTEPTQRDPAAISAFAGQVPSPTLLPAPPPTAPPLPGRSIKIRGLDNDYRGTTRVLPDKKLIHQKDSYD